ncbi:hypothetical protein ACFZDI_21330 [Streptomyces sp. NPDC007907]|uniref:hypothetical protein n=1 Tax=Streptomyces sp. NPDC007907 TaxID=3364789 RepID=UPI0036E54324
MSSEIDPGATNAPTGPNEPISPLDKFNASTGAVGAATGVAGLAKDMGENGTEADSEGLISGILEAGNEILENVWDFLGW